MLHIHESAIALIVNPSHWNFATSNADLRPASKGYKMRSIRWLDVEKLWIDLFHQYIYSYTIKHIEFLCQKLRNAIKIKVAESWKNYGLTFFNNIYVIAHPWFLNKRNDVLFDQLITFKNVVNFILNLFVSYIINSFVNHPSLAWEGKWPDANKLITQSPRLTRVQTHYLYRERNTRVKTN